MDYEEKYNEALNTAKMWYKNTAMPDNVKEIMRRIFPELKESEDEKTWKEIVNAIYDYAKRLGEKIPTSWLAWLEKQTPVDKEEVLKDARRCVALSIMDFIDVNTQGMCMSNVECKNLEDAVVNNNWAKVYAFMKLKLDKQGNKPQGKSTLEATNEEMADNADDFKPKFKVGDWVVLTAGELSATLLIADVDINKELYWFNDDSYLPFADEGCLHLWSIDDAKAGDVLDAFGSPFIYKKHDKHFVYFYCGVNLADKFIEANGNDTWNTNYKVYPATKAQRVLLFEKMHEAGYEWDEERLELERRIE